MSSSRSSHSSFSVAPVTRALCGCSASQQNDDGAGPSRVQRRRTNIPAPVQQVARFLGTPRRYSRPRRPLNPCPAAAMSPQRVIQMVEERLTTHERQERHSLQMNLSDMQRFRRNFVMAALQDDHCNVVANLSQMMQLQNSPPEILSSTPYGHDYTDDGSESPRGFAPLNLREFHRTLESSFGFEDDDDDYAPIDAEEMPSMAPSMESSFGFECPDDYAPIDDEEMPSMPSYSFNFAYADDFVPIEDEELPSMINSLGSDSGRGSSILDGELPTNSFNYLEDNQLNDDIDYSMFKANLGYNCFSSTFD